MPLTAVEVVPYIQAFRQRIVVVVPRWDLAMVEENAMPGAPAQITQPGEIGQLAATDLRDMAPFLVQLLQAQVTTDHSLWWERVVSLTAARWRGEEEALRALSALAPRTIRSQLVAPHMLAAPLLFSVLESALKGACAAYVRQDGTVLQPWNVPWNLPAPRQYQVGGPRVSRVGHLLTLFRTHFASLDSRNALDACELQLRALEAQAIVLDARIDAWRNELIHGENLWTARNPVIAAVLGVLLLERA
jgi:hypothetical protein